MLFLPYLTKSNKNQKNNTRCICMYRDIDTNTDIDIDRTVSAGCSLLHLSQAHRLQANSGQGQRRAFSFLSPPSQVMHHATDMSYRQYRGY